MISTYPKEIENMSEIKRLNIKSLFEKDKFSRGVIMYAGAYAGQDFHSILITKMHDIKNNKFCFWAFSALSNGETLEKAFNFLNEGDGEKYIIMPYTNSSKYAKGKDVSIEAGETKDQYIERMMKKHPSKCYVEGFKYVNSGSDEKIFKKYPENLIPEILLDGKESSAAYLISEFYFAKDNIEIKELCSMFEQYKARQDEFGECSLGNSQQGHALVNLNMKDVVFSKFKDELPDVSYVIAKLEHPYIAQLTGKSETVKSER